MFALQTFVRRNLFAAVAAVVLAVWLVLTAAEAYEPLHAWFHGGTIPKDDDCAVAMILNGQVDVLVFAVSVPLVLAIMASEILTPASIFPAIDYSLHPSRGPPSVPA